MKYWLTLTAAKTTWRAPTRPSGVFMLPVPRPGVLRAVRSRNRAAAVAVSGQRGGLVGLVLRRVLWLLGLDAPCPGCVDVGQLGGDGPAGSADAPGGQALRARLRGAGRVQVTVDDAALPLGKRAGDLLGVVLAVDPAACPNADQGCC